ncbi:MAG: hypothetical protein R2751_10310 [Bacteroidales bacterium]
MRKKILYILIPILGALASCASGPQYAQPTLEARKAEIIEDGAYQFKDLNKNGTLDAYEDWRLPVEERIADLVSQMTLEEKVGLMFHPNIAVPADGKLVYDTREALGQEAYAGPVGPGGQGGGGMAMGQMQIGADVKTYVVERHFRNILNNGVASEFAAWSNAVRRSAEASRLGIPVMFSTDPRHGNTPSRGPCVRRTIFSRWPSKRGQVGITATRVGAASALWRSGCGRIPGRGSAYDPGTADRLDDGTRWSRNMGCFSEDADLTTEMMAAFMEGAQGARWGRTRSWCI